MTDNKRFPDIEAIRSALNHVALTQQLSKLDIFKDTGIAPHWAYAFMADRKGAGSPKYEQLTTLVEFCEAQGVTFTDTGWKAADETEWHAEHGYPKHGVNLPAPE